MNLYFLVEGQRTEKTIYRRWLQLFFPGLQLVHRPEDVTEDTIRLIAAQGFPDYLSRIDDVAREIRDVVRSRVDRFFVCIDAEEQSFERVHDLVAERLLAQNLLVPWTVIVQDCCIETWLLGNRAYIRANPSSDEQLRVFRRLYDVRRDDPEVMPNLLPKRFGTRAQFHLAYLKAAHRERREAYGKKKVARVCRRDYFDQLAHRNREAGHISSFGRLVESWRELGADL